MSFTDEEINEAFSEFDKDGNQVIECSELKGFIKKNCPEIEDCDIDKCVKVSVYVLNHNLNSCDIS